MRSQELFIENSKQLEEATYKILEGEKITKITIRGGEFKAASIIQFSETLMDAKFLEKIDLEFYSKAGSHILHLMTSLQYSGSLKKIKINCPELSYEGFDSIAAFLKFNKVLNSLKINCIKGTENAVQKVAESLKYNTSLTSFALSTYPFLSDKCTNAFLEAIKDNKRLVSVDLPSKNTRLLEQINLLCLRNEITQRSAL